MSVRYITAAAENPNFTASQKLVLLCLGDHADENGVSWPSLARMVHWTGLNRVTLFKGLKDMENAGCVQRGTSTGKVSHYTLNLESIQDFQPVSKVNQVGKLTRSDNDTTPVSKVKPLPT